jgi:hypothetical protein
MMYREYTKIQPNTDLVFYSFVISLSVCDLLCQK